MKIPVDSDELMKVFDIISNVRNFITPYNPVWIQEQMQKACNILGPMWADGVDENHITDRQAIIKILDMLRIFGNRSNPLNWDRTILDTQKGNQLYEDATALKDRMNK